MFKVHKITDNLQRSGVHTEFNYVRITKQNACVCYTYLIFQNKSRFISNSYFIVNVLHIYSYIHPRCACYVHVNVKWSLHISHEGIWGLEVQLHSFLT
jgi:hypothetical protein